MLILMMILAKKPIALSTLIIYACALLSPNRDKTRSNKYFLINHHTFRAYSKRIEFHKPVVSVLVSVFERLRVVPEIKAHRIHML